jgi:hypothetical protein
MIRLFFSLIFLSSGLFNNSIAQTSPFNQSPDWISNANNHVATGLGVADINQDGWDDIIVANGNDIYRQSLVVYYNDGSGSFPLSPSWSSLDIDFHGHLSIGDVNGDNLPDVAVSVFLGPAGFTEAGYVKVYYNQGNELDFTPSFQTMDSMFTFSCALGDADGDGDLDLAVAGGQPYSNGIGPYQTNGRIYFNQNGILDSLPGWYSQVSMAALDVDFADMDKNGYLDLIFACHLTPNYIFLADSNGNISTVPSWNSGDMNYYANSLTIGEIDSNKFLDIVVSDNDQLGGHGKFKSYLFDSTQSGQSNPNWLSNSGGYGSAVLLEDLNFDNNVDVLTGRWWGSVDFYSGISGSFSLNPTWSSSTSSVIEAYILKDVDQDGRYLYIDTVNISFDSIHVVYLEKKTVEKILSVELNGIVLIPGSDYNYNSELKWITFSPGLISGDQIIIEYEYSKDRDLLVSNWDYSKGNYLFYNQTNPTNVLKISEKNKENVVTVFPNPFNNTCKLNIYSEQVNDLEITIFDISGRIVKNLINNEILPGNSQFTWDTVDNKGNPVATGTYFYLIKLDNKKYTGKLLLLR